MFFRVPLLFGLLLAAAGSLGAQSLIAYFPFDGNANDASGHGHVGTVVNATPTTSGYTGGAYQFNGGSSYIQIDSLNINPSVYPQLTMGAWVNANNVSPIRQIISHDDGGYDRSLGIDYRGSVTGWSAFTGSGVLGGQAAGTGVWTFVAVAYDQAAGTTLLYVDGNSYTATAASGAGWSFTRIGMNPSFGEYFSGTIDNVFFFSGALTASQLDSVRLNGVSSVPEPATWALLALGAIALLRRARRQA